MPGDASGRLIIWPTISPRGHKPPRPAFYLTWTGWERYRTSVLGESPLCGGFSPIFIEAPEGFYESLVLLTEASFDGGLQSLQTPFFDPAAEGIRQEILAGPGKAGSSARGARPSPDSGGRLSVARPAELPPHLVLALASAASSSSAEAGRLLREAELGRAAMLAALTGDERESPAGAASEGERSDDGGEITPVPQEASASRFSPAALAWLKLAGPVLGPGDLLWAPKAEAESA
ncbi:MAG: hypothetical protein LBE49_05235 [Deltaproteobacteria bacterium]|jgi:hypothetical protein|nr:hypothetical protein [Deltaproteobacteria bacterium]